ncbi:hypothetical protein AtEden1_Chr5g0082971 [Arabidopsis thaliana]
MDFGSYGFNLPVLVMSRSYGGGGGDRGLYSGRINGWIHELELLLFLSFILVVFYISYFFFFFSYEAYNHNRFV